MKRTLLSCLCLLALLPLAAQTKTVQLQGIVQDTSVKVVEINHLTDSRLTKWETKMVPVTNGAFQASLELPFPVNLNLSFNGRGYSDLFLYSDAKLLIDSSGTPHLAGSPAQDDYEQFHAFMQPNNALYDSMKALYRRSYTAYGSNFPKATMDTAITLRDRYYTQRAALLDDYVARHPDSYAALWELYALVTLPPAHPYFNFDKLFAGFSDRVQRHSFIPVLKERVANSAWMQAGKEFPREFFKGSELLQAKVQGKSRYYLIDFWYSHCAPCIAGFPMLRQLYEQYRGKGFDIVSISVDKVKDEQDYVAAMKKYKLSWNHVWDKNGLLSDKFNINGFPTFVLLDNQNRIINFNPRYEEVESFLKRNLDGK